MATLTERRYRKRAGSVSAPEMSLTISRYLIGDGFRAFLRDAKL
jgi:hypothetical protein